MSTDIQALRAKIAAEDDVLQVLHLVPHGERFLYLIETPFAFPRFVVGFMNAEGAAEQILLQCGAKWTAVNRFAAERAARPLQHKEAA